MASTTTALQVTAASQPAREIIRANRIPTLDGWRGIAILMVIVCHISMSLGSGVYWIENLGTHGVSIFFVLSGYLITSRLLSEHENDGSISLRNFYIRRFFRLMPAAWAYLLFRVLLALASREAIVSVSLMPSLFCFRNYVNVIGPAATAHFWSLSIEEQFYFLWPSVLLLSGRKKAFWIAICGSVTVALWRYCCWNRIAVLHPQMMFETQYRADALLVGCAAALVLPNIRQLLHKWMAFPLLILMGFRIAIGSPLVPLYESIAIALLILITSQNPTRTFGRVLDSRLLSSIGLLSYGLYLWQEILFRAHTIPGILAMLLFMIAAALVSYFFIEQPSIEWGKSIAKRHRV
jgi:peptidoglycan/LPS O-acetylase OafA/YrhL